ncbi:MAG: hypothetical protein V2A34_01615, partial [Lentisphaerota bacterium]
MRAANSQSSRKNVRWVAALALGLCLWAVAGYGQQPQLSFICASDEETPLTEVGLGTAMLLGTDFQPSQNIAIMRVKGEPDINTDRSVSDLIDRVVAFGLADYQGKSWLNVTMSPEWGDQASFYAIPIDHGGGKTSEVVQITINPLVTDNCLPPEGPTETEDPNPGMLSLQVQEGTALKARSIVEVGENARWRFTGFNGATIVEGNQSGIGPINLWRLQENGTGWPLIESKYSPINLLLTITPDSSGTASSSGFYIPTDWKSTSSDFSAVATQFFYAVQTTQNGRTSPVFSIEVARFNNPPTLTLTGPSTTDRIYTTQPTVFRARARDAEDGSLSPFVTWYIDGAEQSLDNVQHDNATDEMVLTIPGGTLDPRVHTIVAEVCDLTGGVIKQVSQTCTITLVDPSDCRRISIRAKGTPLGGVWPTMFLYKRLGRPNNDEYYGSDTSLLQSWTVNSSEYQTYTVDATVDEVSNIWALYLKYFGETIAGGDGNLIVDYVKLTPIEGVNLPEMTLQSDGPGVRYYIENLPASVFNPILKEWIPGQETMFTSGALDFPLHRNDYVDIKAKG